jgi:hypothetical protein
VLTVIGGGRLLDEDDDDDDVEDDVEWEWDMAVEDDVE